MREDIEQILADHRAIILALFDVHSEAYPHRSPHEQRGLKIIQEDVALGLDEMKDEILEHISPYD